MTIIPDDAAGLRTDTTTVTGRPGAPTRSGWLRQWMGANGVGELLGLGLGACLAVPLHGWLERGYPTVLVILAGATVFALVEGTAVGVSQYRALAQITPAVGLLRWWLATAAGGWLAWVGVSAAFASMSAGGAEAQSEPPLLVQLLVMSAAGLLAGPVLGIPQALALRRVQPRPWPWVWANALAWAAGMPVVQLVAGTLPLSGAWLVLVGAVGLFLTGVVVGAIHGPVMYRLVREPAFR